jgi:two-component system chemotaxis response regulator CheY
VGRPFCAAGVAVLEVSACKSGGSGMNRKILLVDEWRAVRLLGRRVLTSLGLQTREARNGLEALETLALEPDLAAILLEWKPDEPYCLELAKRLAAVPRNARPAVVACGDVLNRDLILSALEAGVDDFVQKPFSRENLCAKLEQLGVSCVSESHGAKTLATAR